MSLKNLLVTLCILCSVSSCAVLNTGKDRVVPDMRVQLKISSLHAKKIQEQGLLGTDAGDEPTLIYTINAYDEKGNLLSVNNGLWGTRTIPQDALILSEEFSNLAVHIPANGKVITAFSLIEIDDYKGERKIAKVKSFTKAERYPKFLSISSFEEDRNLPPIEFIAKSLKIAGYKNFVTKHMNLSINDELGGTVKVLDTEDVQKIQTGTKSGKETFEMDGSQINENYLYILKYGLSVSRNKN
jgi:hypothetical protein